MFVRSLITVSIIALSVNPAVSATYNYYFEGRVDSVSGDKIKGRDGNNIHLRKGDRIGSYFSVQQGSAINGTHPGNTDDITGFVPLHFYWPNGYPGGTTTSYKKLDVTRTTLNGRTIFRPAADDWNRAGHFYHRSSDHDDQAGAYYTMDEIYETVVVNDDVPTLVEFEQYIYQFQYDTGAHRPEPEEGEPPLPPIMDKIPTTNDWNNLLESEGASHYSEFRIIKSFYDGNIEQFALQEATAQATLTEAKLVSVTVDKTTRDDRAKTIDRIERGGVVVSELTWEANDAQILWGEIGTEEPLEFGVKKDNVNLVDIEKDVSIGDINLSTELEINPYAYLEAGLNINGGEITSAEYTAKVQAEAQIDNGILSLSASYLDQMLGFEVQGPDAETTLNLNYGLSAKASSVLTDTETGNQWQILGGVKKIDSENPASGWSINDDYTVDLLNPGILPDIDNDEMISALENLIEALPISDSKKSRMYEAVSEYGDIKYDHLDTDTVSFQTLKRLEGKSNEGLVAGAQTELDTRSNTLLRAQLNLVPILLDVAQAKGIPLPDTLFTGEFEVELADLAEVEFEYNLLDINLQGDAGLYQNVLLDPNMGVTFSVDGKTIRFDMDSAGSYNLDVGDVSNGTDKIVVDVRYDVATARYGVEAGMWSNLGLALEDGQMGYEVELFDFDVAEGSVDLYQGAKLNLLDSGNISLLNDAGHYDQFQLAANSDDPHFQWEIDLFKRTTGSALGGTVANSQAVYKIDPLAIVENLEVDGTAFVENGQIVAITNSPTLIYHEFAIPADAVAMSIDFLAEMIVDADILSFLFDDDLLFRITGADMSDDWMSTGLIDISHFAGMDVLFTMALLSPEGISSTLRLDNILFFDTFEIDTSLAAVPIPATWLLLLSGLFILTISKKSTGRVLTLSPKILYRRCRTI